MNATRPLADRCPSAAHRLGLLAAALGLAAQAPPAAPDGAPAPAPGTAAGRARSTAGPAESVGTTGWARAMGTAMVRAEAKGTEALPAWLEV
jgi:hypothetical protein